jgi:hypothetical protein
MSGWMPFRSRVKAPILRFSRTVILEKIRRPSGDWPMPARTSWWAGVFETSLPSNLTVPSRGWRRPEIVLSVVVLPAPFEPISVTISPLPTVSEIPRRAWMWP